MFRDLAWYRLLYNFCTLNLTWQKLLPRISFSFWSISMDCDVTRPFTLCAHVQDTFCCQDRTQENNAAKLAVRWPHEGKCWTLIYWQQSDTTNDKFNINLLKPIGYGMHQQFNIQQLYALPTLYLCVLYLSDNNDLCQLHQKLIGFYNRNEKFLQCGTDWVFK
jgi:hypothetical protein